MRKPVVDPQHKTVFFRQCAAVLSGVLVMFSVMTAFSFRASASSVSDNAFSETQVDESAGDVMDETGHVTNASEAEEQRQEEVQTNTIAGWPEGPSITAGSAILIDADTGTILYGKNIHQQMYPASTTKMLTCLIAAENLDLNDTITFSQTAIDAVPADGSNIGMSVGETITVEQALYGLMVGSANECANALAEKVSGSIDAFVELMNSTAADLGCTDSHFVNANGLYDDNHYTSAYDLSRIAAAFFRNEVCRTVGNCASFHFEATATQPDDFTLTNKHELITGEVPYSGIIGGKTGYTSQSRENLVTGCIQNDTELIAVVMREDDPAQFNDTVTLFDYGYQNFSKQSVSNSASLPAADVPSFMTAGENLLGTSTPALTIASGGYVDLPVTASFSDLTPVYHSDNSITYYFGDETDDVVVGSASLTPAVSGTDTASSVLQSSSSSQDNSTRSSLLYRLGSQYITRGLNGTVYVNVSSFLLTLAATSILLSLYFRFQASMHAARERARQRRRRARRAHAERNDYYENHRYDRDDPYSASDYYDGDYYDNGFSSNYTGSNNYRDDYYGSGRYDDDYYDDYR